METSTSTQSSITFYDFLDKMRNPSSLDLVRSIKSFIVSFSFIGANPENDSKRVQEFYSTMEATISEHPLWAGASDEDIDCAMEGLEKYVMTKLYSRTFAALPDDVKIDQEISERIQLLQTFLRPQHLDIPVVLQNEASWLLAEKELQKINAFKAPREKLLCIMSCCRVINNLLLNAAMSEDHIPGGADDFLPVLIFVMIKANPPQLHSNLKYIQLYRRQSKLVSEAAYYFTNLVSAKSFVVDLNAKSLSIDEIEFEESMKAARSAGNPSQIQFSSPADTETFVEHTDGSLSTRTDNVQKNGRSSYPYMEVEPRDLTVEDVERLLFLYKDVVTKYTNLCSAVRRFNLSRTSNFLPMKNTKYSQAEGTSTNVDEKGGEERGNLHNKDGEDQLK